MWKKIDVIALVFYSFQTRKQIHIHKQAHTHTHKKNRVVSCLSMGNKITVKRKENKFRRSDKTFIKLCVLWVNSRGTVKGMTLKRQITAADHLTHTHRILYRKRIFLKGLSSEHLLMFFPCIAILFF